MGFFPFADPSQTLRRPFTDPSQTLRISSGLRLRASAQGENDNIRRRFFADAQNDNREDQNDKREDQNDKRDAQNDKREAQNDKGETQNDRKGEAE